MVSRVLLPGLIALMKLQVDVMTDEQYFPKFHIWMCPRNLPVSCFACL